MVGAMASTLLNQMRMKFSACLFLLIGLCVEIHALDLNEEARKAIEGLSKQLQKSKIIKVGPRLFNREVTPLMWPKPGERWIGLVGDSSITGAASHPEFHATIIGVLDSAMKHLNPKEEVLSPIRVMYTTEEFKEAEHRGRAFELNLQSDLSQKIDTEEYSFGYMLGRTLGLSADQIVIAAQDGAKVSSMYKQMLRLLAVGSPTLPPLILVSYVANDLCSPKVFSESVEKFRTDYAKDVNFQFDRIAQMPPASGGTRIFIIQPLDLANVLANPDLLSQKVPLESHKDVSCEELRSGKFGNDFTKLMQNSLRGQCSALFNLTDNPGRHLAQTRELQSIQTQVLREAIENFNNRSDLRIKMILATSPQSIHFTAGDLANDCFHPSPKGAAKVATQLRANELKNEK
jgi:hypothetical protein